MRRWICGKDPRQYGFVFGLWTRRIVAELIDKKFDKAIGVTSVGRLLAELEITAQKPLRRAYERDPVAITKWTQEDYPRPRKGAKRRGADIFFIDEAGVRSDAALQRTWGARGETPTVGKGGQRQGVKAISAVNALGAFCTMCIPAHSTPRASLRSSRPSCATAGAPYSLSLTVTRRIAPRS